jgi:RNA polymerase sigma-70 factor (ECF subfamily)
MVLEGQQSSRTPADEALLDLHRRGQTEAFETLVERYRLELFHFLVRFVGDRAAAEDLFQESFLQVFLSADTFDSSRRFRPWLFTIAANKARDHLRRNNRRQATQFSTPLDAGGEDQRTLADTMAGDVLMPAEEVEQQETKERVQRAIAEMPEHLREVLLLAYFHQFAYKQIAEMLSIPLGTVKSRLHAAVAGFAQIWKERERQP